MSDGSNTPGNSSDFYALKNVRLLSNAEGISFIGYGENRHPLDKQKPYLTSVFDKLTGERTDLFGAKKLFELDGDDSSPIFEADEDEVILDIDRVGNRYAILLESLDRSQRVLHGLISDLNEFKNCPADIIWPKGFPRYVSPFKAVETGKYSLGNNWEAHSVSYLLWRAKKARNRQLTVIFHGGPLASSLSPSLRNDGSVARYDCTDVLMVDGTGTVGGGLKNSSNAARFGFDAFRRDALAVRELAEELGYDEVSIVGNSFGGISGAAATTIDWPELRSVSLVAPALQILAPDRTNLLRKGDFSVETVSAKGLSGFDRFVFGDKRDHVNAGMAYFLAAADPTLALPSN